MKTSTRLFFFTPFILSLLFLCNGVSFGQIQPFSLPEGCTQNDYAAQTIIYKVAEPYIHDAVINKSAASKLDIVFSKLQAVENQQLFPKHTAPLQTKNNKGFPLTDLSRIYECTYQSDLPIDIAINMLLSTGIVEYAQPRYLIHPMSTVPNDPFHTNQYQLNVMKMFDAWDYEKGDSTIVVGIADWGVELTHPDLADNIFYNVEDPIDGIDNDNDGYLDNYYGWDMGSNDNNPTGLSIHGTYVSGCSSATTDNGTGVSGIGFRCKFIHIKIADDNNNGTKGYESIVYAADHGCRVINCSWGSVFYQGSFGQDIINYATFNRNSLVVAACGNANNQLLYYPASYDHVLSVAGTNSTDLKWSGSSYGYKVDLCAPGQDVWTTANNGTYNYSSGTSFSSPLVAGAAALLWSHFPDYDPLQITGQLKATCDVIDTMTGNLSYSGLLGTGRVNMARALTDTTTPYVEMLNMVFEDADQDQFFESNDTIQLIGDFYNFLAATSPGFTATLYSLTPYLTIIDSAVTPGVIAPSSSVSNATNPFSFLLASDVPASQILYLKLVLADTGISFNQYFSITANNDYLTIDTNQIGITITSKGAIGYNSGYSTQGIGITYNSTRSLISSAGFMVGVSPTKVSDAVIGFDGYVDQDFLSTDQVRKIQGIADYTAEGTFNDSLSGEGKMHLSIRHTTMAWNQPGREKFIILSYVLENYGTETLTDLYAGIYLDWDLDDNMKNTATWDNQRKLGLVNPFEGGTYAGLQLLYGNGVFHYAFDNDGLNGSIKLTDGFTGLEKYLTLKSNRTNAGSFAPGNDVSHMVSSGPYTLLPGDTAKIVFAILAGDYLTDIQNSADEALLTFNSLSSIRPLVQITNDNVLISPCPFTDRINLQMTLSQSQTAELVLCNYLGQTVYASEFDASAGTSTHEILLPGLNQGIYFLSVKTHSTFIVNKLLKL